MIQYYNIINYSSLFNWSNYCISNSNDCIQVNFHSNEEFTNWTSMLINRNSHNFNTSINENNQVLTLYTCYNDIEKLILHTKLIKKETR